MSGAPGRGFDRRLVARALRESLVRLAPWKLVDAPVLLVTWCSAAAATLLACVPSWNGRAEPPWFVVALAALLWLTLWFATASEALAEGRGRAHAEALRAGRRSQQAVRLRRAGTPDGRGDGEGDGARDGAPLPSHDAPGETIPATELAVGDLYVVRAGEVVPADGDAVAGIASVDESAVTGESAPVIREAGGDRSAVTGGTRLLSDWLVVRVTAPAGGGFLERMIALVEGATRQRTPNEIALSLLLTALTLLFVVVVATVRPFSRDDAAWSGGEPLGFATLLALLVCLIPTTIGGLLPAIGIAGIDRLHRHHVIARSGRAVEAAGDVDVLLLDKTGTITFGNRAASEFLPAPGVAPAELAEAAQLASLGDETPEGRSIVVLAKEKFGLRGRALEAQAQVVPFTAQTRMSGLDLGARRVRKGAPSAIAAFVRERGGAVADAVARDVERIGREGATPLLVAEGGRVLGAIRLRDVVKGGLRERFAELRRMGIRTIMITGDAATTAAAIAAEAGVDEFRAEARPETKLALVRELQAGGRLVAMTGDGTNDAPALAQADVALAMQSGTQAAKEAGNMVDLESNPTKLIEIVAIGKQLLMTRGALTTFSLANDVAKYFAILPAAFLAGHPEFAALDVMQLGSPTRAILAAVLFNALILAALVPVALRGVAYHALPAALLLRRHLLRWGVGGLLAPFAGIKLLELALRGLGVP
ncbi:MAG: potassium-transporting ATPase subunit KdpB [Planctomycetes bacterium]|nr:potassium-transporting ATPase subunit KdpB [Planctomycetota bacterium]